MGKLLYVEASPRKQRSHSIRTAQAFLEAYRDAHPGNAVETWDLWSEPLPEFDGMVLDAKYRILHGQEHTAEEAAAWQSIVDVFNRFAAADHYLFSLPMWNFGIPYKLKHLIDVITQPGLSFSFSPETGYQGLVTGKPAVVVYARGGEYTSNDQVMGMDFQKPYFDLFLGFIGFTQIESLVVEPTLADPAAADAKRAELAERAVELAKGM